MRRVLAVSALLGIGGCSFLVDADGLSETAAPSHEEAPEDGAIDPAKPDAFSADAATESGGGSDGASSDVSISDGLTQGPTYASSVIADNPLMYLRFGDSMNTASPKDEMGHVNVSNIGTPQFGVHGAIANDPDTAVKFDQSGVDCGGGFDFVDQQPFTIELWAIIPDNVVQNAPRFLVRKGDYAPDGAPPPESYALYLSQGPVYTSAVFSRRTNALSDTTDSPFSVVDAAYHHIVAIYTGSYLHLYRDGQLIGSDVADGLSGSKPGHFYVGLRDALNGYANTSIDELAIYDHELSDARVKLHYAIGKGITADQ